MFFDVFGFFFDGFFFDNFVIVFKKGFVFFNIFKGSGVVFKGMFFVDVGRFVGGVVSRLIFVGKFNSRLVNIG